MQKRQITILVAAVLLTGSLSACGSRSETVNQPAQENQTVQTDTATEKEKNSDVSEDKELKSEQAGIEEFPVRVRDTEVAPCVEPYTVEPYLSNIDNLWQLYYLTDGQKELLEKNGFVVSGSTNEFFELYEKNRYLDLASFVTVDSLMHTYHLYFSYLQKNVEKDYLADSLAQLSDRMLDRSIEVYDQLRGSEWENAAKRNVAFFTVGMKLLDGNTEVNADVEDIVEYELSHINQAAGIGASRLTGAFEDYSQYTVRGYYEGDGLLEQYFKAMMWYGRIHFAQEEEDQDRSALLISMMLSEDTEACELWEGIYEITAFFAGASDDSGVDEYIPLLHESYGDHVTADTLLANAAGFEQFHKLTGMTTAPKINLIPVRDGEDSVNKGFRFMSQRFTIDAAIMQNLVHQSTKDRMLPDVLDVPAALGSDTALAILEETGSSNYEGYADNMAKLKAALAQDNKELWSASLYSCWLNTLRPLLAAKGEGYPMFMQSTEWLKKDLECFAGSYTELKHDTVLYTKQVMAEMGGGYEQEPDDRGYVEPEPEVYARFAELSERTMLGLEKYESLSEQDKENLERLTQIADTLLEISKKELRDETLTDAEYEFIRSYGGTLEHFWFETVKDQSDESYIDASEAPAALVVDIATDPAGQVLEAATGSPSTIYVAVRVDGRIKIAIGSVYSFYQFAWPMEDRLTDSRWHQMIGIRPNIDGNYEHSPLIQKPDWTESYRYHYEWE